MPTISDTKNLNREARQGRKDFKESFATFALLAVNYSYFIQGSSL